MAELKRCPFCGSDLLGIRNPAVNRYSVVCVICYSETGFHGTEEEAIEAWNRRV